MIRGVRLARRIAAAPALAAEIAAEWKPGPVVESNDEILDYVRQTGSSIFHPAGTCRMGAEPDCVVDDEIRVHGLTGLRVADCSIMPTLVAGNTSAAAIMIGEKAADMILAARKQDTVRPFLGVRSPSAVATGPDQIDVAAA